VGYGRGKRTLWHEFVGEHQDQEWWELFSRFVCFKRGGGGGVGLGVGVGGFNFGMIIAVFMLHWSIDFQAYSWLLWMSKVKLNQPTQALNM
jgi:hypothetical protein